MYHKTTRALSTVLVTMMIRTNRPAARIRLIKSKSDAKVRIINQPYRFDGLTNTLSAFFLFTAFINEF